MQNSRIWTYAGILSLLMVPVLWLLGFAGTPPFSQVMTAGTDVVGAWLLVRGIMVLATLAALAVGWVCLSPRMRSQ